MNHLVKYIEKKSRALNYVLWGKAIIIANLYEHIPDKTNYDYKPSINGTFVKINSNNLGEYCNYFPSQSITYISERIITFNDTCVAYLVQSKIVYWAFITCRTEYFEPAINTNYQISEDAAFIYDTSTLEDFQRKGIHASAFRHIFENVIELGKKRAEMMVLKVNTPAINNLQKFNFKLIKRHMYIPALGFTTCWRTI
ncbi:MAG: hypothetical protein WC156_02405 [Pedobacter sp.]